MILGQLRIGARQAKNVTLILGLSGLKFHLNWYLPRLCEGKKSFANDADYFLVRVEHLPRDFISLKIFLLDFINIQIDKNHPHVLQSLVIFIFCQHFTYSFIHIYLYIFIYLSQHLQIKTWAGLTVCSL